MDERQTENIAELRGGNLDIDMVPNANLSWPQDRCPWNEAEKTNEHKCAVKNVSICKYFRGIKKLDTVLCAYPKR